MSSFVCIFLSVFLPLSSFPSVPLVFTSCSAVEGSRGGKGMLILSPQRRSGWERETERETGRKWHSSEEMRWPLHPVCVWACARVSVHLHRKDQGDSLNDISVFFPRLAIFPCQVMYRSECLCEGCMYNCSYVCLCIWFFFPFTEIAVFYPLFMFHKSIICLSPFSLLHCSVALPLAQVRNVIRFRGCIEQKDRDWK